MLSPKTIATHQQVQDIARATIHHLKGYIQTGCTEADIAREAERHLKNNGIDGFWYYDIGAFVLVGNRTPLSISGKDYIGPTNEAVQVKDIVTVDLAPMIGGNWGDFARTFIINSGQVVAVNYDELIGKNIDEELLQGMDAEETLHTKLLNLVKPEMTFDTIFREMNAHIQSLGFENLDFHGNLGHTIVSDKSQRSCIQSGNNQEVVQAGLFTFEPHIRKKDQGRYGFKREDIYYLRDGLLKTL